MPRGYIDQFGEYCEYLEDTYDGLYFRKYEKGRKIIKQYKHLPRELKGIRYFFHDNKVKDIKAQNNIIFDYWFNHLNCYFKAKTEDQLFIQIAEYIQLNFVKFVRTVRKETFKNKHRLKR